MVRVWHKQRILHTYNLDSKCKWGTDDTTVSKEISGLSSGTTYYYRLVAESIGGTTYGDEASFTTTSASTAIYGYARDNSGDAVEGAKVRLKGKGSSKKDTKNTYTDTDGYFEFTGLDADTYTLIARKKGYKKAKKTVRLDAGEEEEVDFEMEKK